LGGNDANAYSTEVVPRYKARAAVSIAHIFTQFMP